MPGDLKTPFSQPAISSADPGGDGVAARGTDPMVDTSGSSGLKDFWDSPVAGMVGPEESANSMSGLPGNVARQTPSPAEPPAPPSLQDRSPGTIDER